MIDRAAERAVMYFEDVVPGEHRRSGPYAVERAELVSFARDWDPFPHHTDGPDVTAPGVYILAIKMRLIHRLRPKLAAIATAGYDELRFHQPVRPGDALTLDLEWLDARPSSSKPDRGIVKLRARLTNGNDTLVLSHLDTLLVWKSGYGREREVAR